MRISGLEGLDAVIHDLDNAGPRLSKDVEGVMKRAGVEMAKKMREDFSGSRHFGHIARSVSFDHEPRRVEVGPDRAKSSSAPLAGIAYFGGANGGGGTVTEPDYILEDEAETAAEYVGKAIEGLL